MSDLTRIATRLFGTPLLMDRARLDVILGTIGPRLGLQPAPRPRADSDYEDQPATPRRGYEVTGEGVAIIPILGALVARSGQMTAGCTELRSYASIGRELDAAQRDVQVRGIVLDIDSPGGEAANVMEFAARVAAMRGGKPLIAAINPGAYSAAYAIASAADRIVIPRTGGVGSVGVVALHVDRSGEDEKIGHRYTWIAAGDRKLDGNPHAPLTDAAEAVIRAEVDRLYGIFTDLVATNRAAMGLTLAKVRASEAGLFFGENAVAAGFADEVGTIEDAVRIAAGTPTSTGRGRPSARNPNSRGAKMEDQNPAGETQATTNPNAAPAVDTAAIAAAARASVQAEAQEIAALCELAGVPARAAGFITAGKSAADVRATLLAEKAEAAKQGGEIQGSRPAAPQGGLPANNNAASMAGWDRAGRQAFGDKWKGF